MFKSFYVLPESRNRTDARADLAARFADTTLRRRDFPCPLCGGTRFTRLFANDCAGVAQDTVLCDECALVQLNPRLDEESTARFYNSDIYRRLYSPSDVLAAMEANYERLKDYSPAPFDPVRRHKFSFFEFLHAHGLAYDSVCEIGSGCGLNLLPFDRLGLRTSGFDFSPGLTALGQKLGFNVRVGSLDDIPGPSDLTIMIHVLEHFVDPLAGLARVAPLTGRYLLLEVPGFVTQVPKIQLPHNFYFSLETLTGIAARAGFRLLDSCVFPGNDYILGLFERCDAAENAYDRQALRRRTLRAVATYRRGCLAQRLMDMVLPQRLARRLRG